MGWQEHWQEESTMKTAFTIAAWALISIGAATLAGCATGIKHRVAEGVEDASVLQDITGIITQRPGRGDARCIAIIHLDTKRRRCAEGIVIDEPVMRAQAIDNGKKIVVMNHYFAPHSDNPKQFNPGTFNLTLRDGTARRETALTSWQTSSAGSNVYDKMFSISPDETTIAMVRDDKDLRIDRLPLEARRQGPLELFDMRTNTWRDTGTVALNEGAVVWLSAEEIAYVRSVPRKEAQVELLPRDGEFASEFQNFPVMPMVFVRSLVNGRERALHAGVDIALTPDKKQLLIRDTKNRLRMVDVASGRHRAVTLNGIANRGVIGFVAPDRVLYWALPSEGRETRETLFNSPLVGPKQMLSLKIGVLDTNRFATVVPFIDPRADPMLLQTATP
jgi:hypothetical protein